MPEVCLHCEQAPQETYLRLCRRCAGVDGLRRVYKRTANWTPRREARIQAYVERAKRELPLFDVQTSRLHTEEAAHETNTAAPPFTCP